MNGLTKTTENFIEVYEEPPELGALKTHYTIESDDFEDLPKERIKKSLTAGSFLIIGFDTEFKTPKYHVTRDDILDGAAKYKVLSYQFHAKTEDGKEWQGICCTENGERLSIGQFLIFILGKGARTHGIKKLPRTIFLVGHFTRADIPAFADFKDQTQFLASVRNTFLSIDQFLKIPIKLNSEENIDLKVLIRDTMLLTPGTSKSLAKIGEMVGFPKLSLYADPEQNKIAKENMDVERKDNWQNYKAYALMDASICVRYIEKIIDQYHQVTGKKKVPVTLTSIGVDLLLKSWIEDLKIDRLDILGKEIVKERTFNKKKNYYSNKNVEVDVEELSHHIDFLTFCYHGGRNEQFWFGPAFEDNWIDIDLASAYPTAMSLIGKPEWRRLYETKSLNHFTPTTLGFAWVDFKFPSKVKHPVMPVRTDNGLVFPLEGTSYCGAPEINAALHLGCRIKIRKGLIVPTNSDVKVFEPFIRRCIERRNEAGSGTLEGLFWKEISNSTYGKTAQGLRKKRVYNMAIKDTEKLPPSRITNPCFAGFTTSYARAVLGEIINSVGDRGIIFSCTTDGFITNLPEEDIESVAKGTLSNLYAKARNDLIGSPKIVEIKHSVRQPLGWRTRGQATLKQHDHLKDKDKGIILAKGGIFTSPEAETDEQKNKEILELFFNRKPDSKIEVESLTGVKDIVEHDADLVSKVIEKRLSMEYDWKNQPTHVSFCESYGHVKFETRPWQSVDQFQAVRNLWDEYTKGSPKCIKTVEDFNAFADHIECRAVSREKSKYLHKEKPDERRLRQSLCSAWQQSEAGIVKDPRMTANQFAMILNSVGIQCKRSDVENGKKKPFELHSCPPTDKVRNLLGQLKEGHFPRLKPNQFLMKTRARQTVTIRPNISNPAGNQLQ